MAALGLVLSLNLEGIHQQDQYSLTLALCLIVYRAFPLTCDALNHEDETTSKSIEKFYKTSFGSEFLEHAQKQDINGLSESARD